MATITDIRPQVKRQGYYNLYIDGSFCCSLSELGLQTGNYHIRQELSPQELEQLKAHSQTGKLKDATLRYLGIRARSERELRLYLRRKGADEELTVQISKWLEGLGYINDQAFAESWVRDRMQSRPRSRRQLQAELAQKGVDRAIVDRVLAEQESLDVDMLQAMITKKMRLSRYRNKQKLQQYLLQQGFAYSDVQTALNAIDFDSKQNDIQ